MRYKLCRCGGVKQDARGSVCSKCGSGKKQTKRVGTTKSGYGWDWQQLQARFITHNPLCVECGKNGIVTAAQEVHHIVPITEAPWLRLQWDNLMALCVACHRAIDQERRDLAR